MSEEEPTAEVATSRQKTDDRGLVRRVLTVDPERFDVLFTGGMLLFILAMIVISFDYRPTTRLVPLVVAVPTAIMLGVALVMIVSDRASAFVDQYTGDSILGVDDEELGGGKAKEEELDPEEALYRQRKRQIVAFGSILSLLTLVYVIGFMAAIPIFLVVLYRLWAKQSWIVTLGTTLFVWLFVYVVFYVLLGARLYTGLLDVNVMDYIPL